MAWHGVALLSLLEVHREGIVIDLLGQKIPNLNSVFMMPDRRMSVNQALLENSGIISVEQ